VPVTRLEEYEVKGKRRASFYVQIGGSLIRQDACTCFEYPKASADCPVDAHKILSLFQHWEW